MTTLYQPGSQFRAPNRSWPSPIFRIFYLLAVGRLWSVAFVYLFLIFSGPWSTTSVLVTIFYFIFLSMSLLLYAFYFFRGITTTTILPCISQTWYKIYTVFILGFMVVLVAVASIETFRASNGQYTTYPMLERLDCNAEWFLLSPIETFFGLVSGVEGVNNSLGANFSNTSALTLSGNTTPAVQKLWI